MKIPPRPMGTYNVMLLRNIIRCPFYFCNHVQVPHLRCRYLVYVYAIIIPSQIINIQYRLFHNLLPWLEIVSSFSRKGTLQKNVPPHHHVGIVFNVVVHVYGLHITDVVRSSCGFVVVRAWWINIRRKGTELHEALDGTCTL